MSASATKSNAACAHISIQIRPVTAKIVPNTRPTIAACSTPASPWSSEQSCGERHDQYFRTGSRSKDLAESFEQISPEQGLLSESRANNHGEQHSRQRSRIPCQVMVGLIDRIGAKSRHHQRFHHKLE